MTLAACRSGGRVDLNRGIAVAGQPARDGGVVDVDAAVAEPAPKLRRGAALVRQREQFMGVAVEPGARVPGAASDVGLRLEARRLRGRVECCGGLGVRRVAGRAQCGVGGGPTGRKTSVEWHGPIKPRAQGKCQKLNVYQIDKQGTSVAPPGQRWYD